MSNKKLKTLTFPGLGNTYTIPQTAGDLTYSDSATYDSGTVGNELSTLNSNKANKTGYYATLGAGVADNLASRGSVEATYTRRTSGGTADIGTGSATIKSIHGNTIVWNQLVRNTYSNSTCSGITITNNDDGTITLNGTATESKSINIWNSDGSAANSVSFVSGHKYLLRISKNPYSRAWGYSGGNAMITSTEGIATSSSTGRASGAFYISPGDVFDNVVIKTNVIDLTQMFGSGNEPTTVADFKALFPLDYYAYNTGSLLSFNGTGIKTDGFNQWDEEWESGAYNYMTGEKEAQSGDCRSKNLIPCFPSTTYYCKNGSVSSTAGTIVVFFDAERKALPYEVNVSYKAVGNTQFVTPTNAYYFGMYWVGTTYNNDICINLSWSGYRNGEYEAYWTETRALPVSTYFANGMRSAGSVYDELTPSKAITRIGVVDLGSLNWTYDNGSFASAESSAAEYESKSGSIPNIVNIKYEPVASTYFSAFKQLTNDDIITIATNQKQIFVRDTSYTDATAFKTAMSGVYLFYELATPTETAISPALSLNYRVDDFGTETLLPVNDDEPTTSPIIYDVAYAMNAVDAIRNLAKNYIGKDSWDTFVSAMSAKGFTITTTWDSTNSKYNITVAYDRVPTPPTTDGTYKLTCTVADGTPTYSWVSA